MIFLDLNKDLYEKSVKIRSKSEFEERSIFRPSPSLKSINAK
jgi:hypothetical protein